jgi:uncharacterized protein (DUF1697 family)
LNQIVLLRGINLGPRNRIAMPALREALSADGLRDVRTYVQSGNVVLSSEEDPAELADRIHALIAQAFGLDIAVVVRTRDELAEVVARNPLAEVAVNPKRYQVTFLGRELEQATLEKLEGLKLPDEQFVATGRELYAWHPDGVARSKLWPALAKQKSATARNWTTVTQLLAMADEAGGSD